MFLDPVRVGSFAITKEQIRRGDGDALFRLLVATAMFQRRQDTQILRILRGLSASDVGELTSSYHLLVRADRSRCHALRSNARLIAECDLAKDPETKRGYCETWPKRRCHLKRHTELLKRYGHFGKVPTSIALTLRESGGKDLVALHARVLREAPTDLDAAIQLERALCTAWRVNQKIASMYLSMLCNPDLSAGLAPWSIGVDWTHFVVIDSNVDLFLGAVGYAGPSSYDGRRGFVQALARSIDLAALAPKVHAYNPRIVQQALYLFMSRSNRRAISGDCSNRRARCAEHCDGVVRSICPLR